MYINWLSSGITQSCCVFRKNQKTESKRTRLWKSRCNKHFFDHWKGVAALAGMLLAIDPNSFVILLLICAALMFVFNYVVAAPVSASILAPFLVGMRLKSFGAFFFLTVIGTVIIAKHKTNFIRIKNGTEMKVDLFGVSSFSNNHDNNYSCRCRNDQYSYFN